MSRGSVIAPCGDSGYSGLDRISEVVIAQLPASRRQALHSQLAERMRARGSAYMERAIQRYVMAGRERQAAESRRRWALAAASGHECERDVLARRPRKWSEARAHLSVMELEDLERANMVRALEASGWKVAGAQGAAALLGINPSTLDSRMNDYFEQMVEIIVKYEGTLDKFVGDEIMALFGGPITHPDDAYRAVKVACEQLRALAEWNKLRVAHGEPPIHIGVGISSGEVVAGYLGSSSARGYTVIGDVVNTASRLCSTAKADEVIIGKKTYDLVKDYFDADELPPTQVGGKAQPVQRYRVLAEKAARRA